MGNKPGLVLRGICVIRHSHTSTANAMPIRVLLEPVYPKIHCSTLKKMRYTQFSVTLLWAQSQPIWEQPGLPSEQSPYRASQTRLRSAAEFPTPSLLHQPQWLRLPLLPAAGKTVAEYVPMRVEDHIPVLLRINLHWPSFNSPSRVFTRRIILALFPQTRTQASALSPIISHQNPHEDLHKKTSGYLWGPINAITKKMTMAL